MCNGQKRPCFLAICWNYHPGSMWGLTFRLYSSSYAHSHHLLPGSAVLWFLHAAPPAQTRVPPLSVTAPVCAKASQNTHRLYKQLTATQASLSSLRTYTKAHTPMRQVEQQLLAFHAKPWLFKMQTRCPSHPPWAVFLRGWGGHTGHPVWRRLSTRNAD